MSSAHENHGSLCVSFPNSIPPQVEDEIVQSKGRLGPGNMITLDLESGEFKENVEVKMDLASKAPYAEVERVVARRPPQMRHQAFWYEASEERQIC